MDAGRGLQLERTERNELFDPTGADGRKRTVLGQLWADWRLAFIVAVVLAAGFGLISAWLTPRGPVTTAQALVSLAAALAVGVGTGLVTGSRWSMIATPVVYVAVFELARMGTEGLTAEGINLDSGFGILAFVVGRVVPGLLVLLPMIVGARYGAWLASRLGHRSAGTMGSVGWITTGLATLALAVMTAAVVLPATTPPIRGADGEPLEGSVAELATVSIGGHDLTMMIRGRSVDSPVLLYLAGIPGGTDLGAMRRDVTLEQDFVVVTWDRRGSGKSYPALDPTDTFTIDQEVADTIEVTNYLRERFDEQKIYLVGQSGGTTIGGLAVQRRPELYHAFVGVGQMVSLRETDILFWDDTLAWAEETGNTALADSLRDNGPPPYADIRQYELVISGERDWNTYAEFDPNNEMPAILFVPEYTWLDRINALRGSFDAAAIQYPQLQDLDFRREVPRLEVPFYMVLGEHEARGRAVLADEWFDLVDAPAKERFILPGAGHRANFDQPELFAQLMVDVLEQTGQTTGDRAGS